MVNRSQLLSLSDTWKAENKEININVPKKYQSIFLPGESVWNKCWSLPILSFQEKKDLALNWNNS